MRRHPRPRRALRRHHHVARLLRPPPPRPRLRPRHRLPLPPLPFTTAPLDTTGILTPDDKVRIAEELRARHRLTTGRCLAYGDSMSDAPLFRHLANTIAVNADHHLADIAALDYRGTDLNAAYALARTLL